MLKQFSYDYLQTKELIFFLEYTKSIIDFFELEKQKPDILLLFFLLCFVVVFLFCEAVTDVRKQGNNEGK